MSNKISNKRKLFSAIVLTVGLFVVLLSSMIDSNNYKSTDERKDDEGIVAALHQVPDGQKCVITKTGGAIKSSVDKPAGAATCNYYTTSKGAIYGCWEYSSTIKGYYYFKAELTGCVDLPTKPSKMIGKLELVGSGVDLSCANCNTNFNNYVTCTNSTTSGGCLVELTYATNKYLSSSQDCEYPFMPSSIRIYNSSNVKYYVCTKKVVEKKGTVTIKSVNGGSAKFSKCTIGDSKCSVSETTATCIGEDCQVLIDVSSNSEIYRDTDCKTVAPKLYDFTNETNTTIYACKKETNTKAKYVYAKNRSGNDKLNVTCYSSGGACVNSSTCNVSKGTCTFTATAQSNYNVSRNSDCSYKQNKLVDSVSTGSSDINYYACPKNSGGSSGGTYTPVPEPPVEDNKTVFKNQFFYANGNQYQGNSIKCGDKVYVTTCSKGDNAICNVTSINEVFVSTTTQIYEKDLVANEKDTGCYQKIERYIAEKTYYYSDRELSINKTEIACGSVVTFKQEIKNACVNKSCEVEYNGKTVYINIDYITSDKPACQNQNISDGNTGGNTGGNTKTCVTSKNVTGAKGEVPVSICKKDDTEDTRNKIVSCAEDYEFKYKLTNDTCKDSNSDNCYKDYLYTCSYIKRPGVNASAGTVGSNGKGIITVTGVPYGNIGILGYHVSSGDEPTVNSGWSTFNAINNSFSIERSAGTYFIWAINNKRRISYPVLAKVYDADLSTTLASFKVQDGNGNDINTNISSLDGTVGYTTGVKDSKYALLSNSLIADSVGGFDKLTTSYELSVNSNKIALYATLTSSDASYVSGYEPRTIDLEYGRNVALIKIVNKDGKERCYTFIINRVDDRNNSNLLKNIKLSRGSIDFNPYTTNYDVKISRFTKKVSVNAELDSSTSTFIKGYEPREVEITEDRQSVVLKVISEAGSIRSYVITFIRNGEDKDNVNSAFLSSLTVPGTMLGFDKETYDYTITVPYETEDLPIYAFAESETASVTVGNNTGLKVGNNLIQIEVKNNNKTRIYSLHVIRKESGLDISDSAKLGTLSIKNYNIEFSPDKLDYEVKIKREKTLLISATPESNRADIYMYGNNDLTGFSTIRVKVIAENGLTNIYSIDIQKAAYNKKIEIIASVAGVSALLIVSLVIYLKKKNNKRKEYLEG